MSITRTKTNRMIFNFLYSKKINAIKACLVFNFLMLMVLCHSKRLVSSRGIEAYRADFDTLTPGNMINHKVFHILIFLSSLHA
jgi:hypothetical protein